MKKKPSLEARPTNRGEKEKYCLKGENGFRAASTVKQLLKDLEK